MNIPPLTQRKDFIALTNSGNHISTKGLVLQTKENNLPGIRLGITASKKLGNAVTRNRIKRRLRALAREILVEHAKPSCDYVLVGRNGTKDREYNALKKDLVYALHTAGVFGEGVGDKG